VFDTIAGLPLHPLAVHAVVVLLPLMAVITIAVAARPGWRRFAGPVVVGDAVVLVASFVAKQSGETFQHRLSVLANGAQIAKDHAREGNLVPPIALALLVAAIVVWLARRRPALVVLSVVLAVVTGAGAIGWTLVVGHSGATAAWSYVTKS